MKAFTLPQLKALAAENRLYLTQTLGLIIGVSLLIISAKIQIPFWPVPLTMQSAVALMLPCVLGMRAGAISIAVYLGLGAAGYPVFAHASMAATGPAYFAGPTGGYLLGFLLAGMAAGAVYERFRHALNIVTLSCLMLAGHAVILTAGVAWLAYGLPSMGLEHAVAAGLIPFLFGSLAKSVFAALAIQAVTRQRPAS